MDKFPSYSTVRRMIKRHVDSYMRLEDSFDCPNKKYNVEDICATNNNEVYAFDPDAEIEIGTACQLPVLEPSESNQSDFEDPDDFLDGLRKWAVNYKISHMALRALLNLLVKRISRHTN